MLGEKGKRKRREKRNEPRDFPVERCTWCSAKGDPVKASLPEKKKQQRIKKGTQGNVIDSQPATNNKEQKSRATIVIPANGGTQQPAVEVVFKGRTRYICTL